ncbi:MAG: hypothetical protein ACJAZ3_000096 [Sphingobacteriales bacterium]|jgi:hypothetical protein
MILHFFRKYFTPFTSLLGFSLVNVFLIWIHPNFITLDGQLHTYNAFVFLQMVTDSSHFFHQFLEFNFSLFPNWTSTAILSILHVVFTPKATYLLFLTLLTLSLPIAFYFCIKQISKPNFLILLILPFIWHRMFFLGFLNFSLSLAILFICIAFLIKALKNLSGMNLLLLLLSSILLFFTHPVASLVFFIFAGIYAAFTINANYHWVSKILPFLAIGPAMWLFARWVLSNKKDSGDFFVSRWNWEFFKDFSSMKMLQTFSATEGMILKFLAITILLTFVIQLYLNRKNTISTVISITALAVLILSFSVSMTFGGGEVIIPRLVLLFYILALAAISSTQVPKIASKILSIIFVVFWAFNLYECYPKHLEIANKAKGIAEIILPSTPHTVLLLNFNPGRSAAPANYPKTSFYRHIDAGLNYNENTLLVQNLLAHTNYSPVKWKSNKDPYLHLTATGFNEEMEQLPPKVNISKFEKQTHSKVDYVFVWGAQEFAPYSESYFEGTNYHLAKTLPKIFLFKRFELK